MGEACLPAREDIGGVGQVRDPRQSGEVVAGEHAAFADVPRQCIEADAGVFRFREFEQGRTTGAAIPVVAHACDEIEAVGIDAVALEGGLAHVEHHDLGDHQVTASRIAAGIDVLQQAAFHDERGLGHARRGDQAGG
jgi:hypothetical protein